MSFSEGTPETSAHSSVLAGVRAAGILEEACRRSLDESGTLQLEVVRDLARDIGWQLDVLSQRIAADRPGKPAGTVVDAALACADLATLAACNLEWMASEEATRGAEAGRLAARAASALADSVEEEESPSDGTDYLMRDARGARWRADLAARQVEEL